VAYAKNIRSVEEKLLAGKKHRVCCGGSGGAFTRRSGGSFVVQVLTKPEIGDCKQRGQDSPVKKRSQSKHELKSNLERSYHGPISEKKCQT